MGDDRMKPVFGEKDNIESAKQSGIINDYDLLLLNNGEVGWIDGKSETVMNTPRTQNDVVTANGMTIESGKTMDEILQLFAEINDNSFIELSEDASAERFVKYISPSFAIGSYYQIQLAIEQGIITHPTYVFYPDRNILYFIDSDLKIYAINEEKSYSYNDLTDIPITNLAGEVGDEVILSKLEDGFYSVTGQYKIDDAGTICDTSNQVLFVIESDESEKHITKIGANEITLYTITLETGEVSETNYATEDQIAEVADEIYQKMIGEIPTIKMSELDNDIGFLTEDDIGRISDETIADLFI